MAEKSNIRVCEAFNNNFNLVIFFFPFLQSFCLAFGVQ